MDFLLFVLLVLGGESDFRGRSYMCIFVVVCVEEWSVVV